MRGAVTAFRSGSSMDIKSVKETGACVSGKWKNKINASRNLCSCDRDFAKKSLICILSLLINDQNEKNSEE